MTKFQNQNEFSFHINIINLKYIKNLNDRIKTNSHIMLKIK